MDLLHGKLHTPDNSPMSGKGLILVILQMMMMAIFAIVPSGYGPPLAPEFVCFILVISGIFIGGWALLIMGGSFSVFPHPSSTSTLLESGPYKKIRHPMYTAVLLTFTGIALFTHSIPRLLITGLLLILFFVKSKYEETLLIEKFSGYTDYRKRTGRFLPQLRVSRDSSSKLK